jgi:hypothetical protein
MAGPSIIFYSIFILPLVVFLIWLMRQDKRKGIIGIILVAALVIIGIAYTYITKELAQKQQYDRSGTAVPHKDS